MDLSEGLQWRGVERSAASAYRRLAVENLQCQGKGGDFCHVNPPSAFEGAD